MNPVIESKESEIRSLVSATDLFIRYQHAFRDATGRRLSLSPPSLRPPLYPRLQIPLKVDDKLVGFLSVDPYRISGSDMNSFDPIANRMLDNGATPGQLRAARRVFDRLPEISASLSTAMETMIQIFAIQLGEVASKAFLQVADNEPATIRKARRYILEHLGNEMTLDEVASFAGVSPYHFCKIFKKATALTFTEFVTKARIEKAKQLLSRPQMRITEIAYEVGFQSLSQFNRSFRKLTAHSPTEYRRDCSRSLRPGIVSPASWDSSLTGGSRDPLGYPRIA